MKFFATCAKGTEGALRKELAAAGLKHLKGERGGVHFGGTLEAGMRACLHSRTAMRVLLEVATFPAPDRDGLYEGARAAEWTEWLTPKHTFAVEANVASATLTHSGFAALVVKDAVVDALRESAGDRPNVDPKDPDVLLVLHVARDQATLSLDLAGHPLHRRGYRAAMTKAPLKETLGAAMLSLGGVPLDAPFVDPMAGSGTLAIEQALRARRIPPGLGRAFGFQRWPGYRGGPQSAWDRLRAEARANVLPRAPAPILARDLNPKAVAAIRENAEAAGVAADIVIERGDARDLVPGQTPGTICTNPPYGERLGGVDRSDGPPPRQDRRDRPPDRRGAHGRDRGRPSRDTEPEEVDPYVAEKKLVGFYRGVAEMLERHAGWTAVILSGNTALQQALPWRPEVDHKLWNGPLEVHLLRYAIPARRER
jgi:putative N6-adenine-specific DNA methylase